MRNEEGCRNCLRFCLYKCDLHGQVPDAFLLANDCQDHTALPDPVQILTNWIAQGAPDHCRNLLDAIMMRRYSDELGHAVNWVYGLRDTPERRSILFHFPAEGVFYGVQ